MDEETETTYTCSISGAEATEADLVTDAAEDDDLGDLPLDWIEITVRSRVKNPERDEIDVTKAALIEQQLGTVPPANRDAARRTIAILVNAQFCALEQITPRYLTADRVVHVSADHRKTALAALGVTEEEE